MQLHDVLIRPVITEKSTMLMEEGKYTFRVPLTANKVQIRQAVEKIFNVKVEKVATIRVLGKTKRWVVHKVNVAITKKLSLL